MNTDLQTLPDYPSLVQLANALWRVDGDNRGAAAIVGAGFSRNAILSGADTTPPPLWNDLAQVMRDRLYGSQAQEAPNDPLRLAEEFRIFFGSAALTDLIRSLVRDETWSPGELHRDFLALPWTEVLTTNWDTLLDRAALEVDTRAYSIVRRQSDIARAPSPRVVKLHGCLNSSDHLIIAEEDYRSYPKTHSAFVNFDRQVFIENDLCLVGFKGDDPNFLQWAGWIRDELPGSARRIFLVGALNLSPAKRKFLEARNIAPIDLYPALKNATSPLIQRDATALLLNFLKTSEPVPSHTWQPAALEEYNTPASSEDSVRQFRDDQYAVTLVTQNMLVWRKDRLSYPNWLICPSDRRTSMAYFTPGLNLLRANVLSLVGGSNKYELLREVSWRLDTALAPMTDQIYQECVKIIKSGETDEVDEGDFCAFGSAVLREARIRGELIDFHAIAELLHSRNSGKGELLASISYQKCLLARDSLDYERLESELENVLSANDPIWFIRKISLLCEIGRFNEARPLLHTALNDLRERHRRDRRSYWILARLAWAEWLMLASERSMLKSPPTEKWPQRYREIHCDPYEILEHMEGKISKEVRSLQDSKARQVALFEPGYVQSEPVHIQSWSESDSLYYMLDCISERVGIPMRLPMVNLLCSITKDAIQLRNSETTARNIKVVRAVSDRDDDLLKHVFSRVSVARMSNEVARETGTALRQAISFALQKRASVQSDELHFWESRLNVFVEALARVAIRATDEDALENFNLSRKLAEAQPITHFRLFSAIDRLARFSIEAIEPASRGRLLLEAVSFPMPPANAPLKHEWPNPIECLRGVQTSRAPNAPAWSAAVDSLLRAATPGSPNRDEALLRLTYLYFDHGLTTEESHLFADALWATVDSNLGGLPTATRLSTYTFAWLPSPPDRDAQEIVRRWLFGPAIVDALSFGSLHNSNELTKKLNILTSFAAAGHKGLYPISDLAQELFVRFAGWRSEADASNSLESMFLRPYSDGCRRLVAQGLINTILPACNFSDLPDQFERLVGLIEEGGAKYAIAGLPYFIRSDKPSHPRLVRRIARAFGSRDSDEVAGGAGAVQTWLDLIIAGKLEEQIPEDLIRALIASASNLTKVNRIAILAAIRRLVESDYLPIGMIEELTDALDVLFVEADYHRVLDGSREAASVSLVRAECVRIAIHMRRRDNPASIWGEWLSAGREDPLPEVRFATISTGVALR